MKTFSRTLALIMCLSFILFAIDANATHNTLPHRDPTSDSMVRNVKICDSDESAIDVDACCEALAFYDVIDCSMRAKQKNKPALWLCILTQVNAKENVVNQCRFDPESERDLERREELEMRDICETMDMVRNVKI